MTIFHLMFSFTTGGAETLVVDMINVQCKKENVKLVIINNQYNKALLKTIDPSVQIVTLDRTPGEKLPFSTILKLWALILKEKPDVIHCHNHNLIRLIFPWKNKAVVTVHDVKTPTKYLNKYSKVFSISNEVAADLNKRGDINSVVVYNGILIDQYKKRENYKFNADEEFKIIQISRLTHEKKGQHIAIHALKDFLNTKSVSNAHLYFVGDGESQDELTKLAKELNISENVHFLGQKTRDWVKQNLHFYHILIQPSLYEGFGLTILEGLAANLPVIASNIDGPKEILTLLNVGYLIQSDDYIALSKTFEAVYSQYLTNTVEIENIVPLNNLLKTFDIITTSVKYLEEYNR